MRKAPVVAAAVFIGLALAARRWGGSMMRHVDWEKRFEQMPENAPPKWMFRNITAIRQNTDRMLELLERERGGRATSAVETTSE